MLLPLEHYNRLRTPELPRKMDSGNCRHGYGIPVMAQWGPVCAYCGRDFSESYEAWLDLSVDHVVPAQALRLWDGLHKDWLGALVNLVPCCRACNELLNGYKLGLSPAPPASLQEFLELRDSMLAGKREHALRRHAQEREFYAQWLNETAEHQGRTRQAA